jgi:hypothetical protein
MLEHLTAPTQTKPLAFNIPAAAEPAARQPHTVCRAPCCALDWTHSGLCRPQQPFLQQHPAGKHPTRTPAHVHSVHGASARTGPACVGHSRQQLCRPCLPALLWQLPDKLLTHKAHPDRQQGRLAACEPPSGCKLGRCRQELCQQMGPVGRARAS